MKISVLVEWQVRSDAITTAKNLLAETYAGTRQFEGCHRYEIYEGQESLDRIFLLTQWDSRSHFDRYIAWRQETGVLEEFGKTFAAPPKIHVMTAISS